MNAEFGLIGLGVMGKSLSRNLARQGFSLALFNRFVKDKEEKVAESLIKEFPEFGSAAGFEDLQKFVAALKSPRKILLMLPAGSITDAGIEALLPYLQPGDALMDGGNAHYKDSQKRLEYLKDRDIHFLACGISGGEKGALEGPSMMAGGSEAAYQLFRPYLEAIAARDLHDLPCVAFVGRGGAGHFVKMIHNGIEYAEMQLLAEMYHLLREGNQLHPDHIAKVFESWQGGELSSYLLEITIQILKAKEGTDWLLDKILDKARQKGTGGWSLIAATELGVPATMISTALFARFISAQKERRTKQELHLQGSTSLHNGPFDLSDLKKSYCLARMINHQQGLDILKAASQAYQWDLNLSEIARVWTEGCIIRSAFMIELVDFLKAETDILLSKAWEPLIQEGIPSLQRTVSQAALQVFSLSTHRSALDYLISMGQEDSPANLIQAQRDYFGAHTYQRKDDPSGSFHHTNWEEV